MALGKKVLQNSFLWHEFRRCCSAVSLSHLCPESPVPTHEDGSAIRREGRWLGVPPHPPSLPPFMAASPRAPYFHLLGFFFAFAFVAPPPLCISVKRPADTLGDGLLGPSRNPEALGTPLARCSQATYQKGLWGLRTWPLELACLP